MGEAPISMIRSAAVLPLHSSCKADRQQRQGCSGFLHEISTVTSGATWRHPAAQDIGALIGEVALGDKEVSRNMEAEEGEAEEGEAEAGAEGEDRVLGLMEVASFLLRE